VRDDDLGDACCIGAGASTPEADGRAANALIQVAVDDRDNEPSRTDDLRRGRLTTNRGHLCAAEVALRGLGPAAGSDRPDEQQCDP
jgi:hypothetical protein